MDLEAVSKVGNEASAQLCTELLDRFGPGVAYECAVGGAATTLLFHAFRIRRQNSTEKALELLSVILDDLAFNIKKTSGEEVKFTVQGLTKA